MKWIDPGNELNTISHDIVEKFNRIENIAIFGCGILGKGMLPVLENYGLFDAFIDNDTAKQINGWNGYKVWDIQEYITDTTGKYIVIAANDANTREIEALLISKGLEKGKDFTDENSFMTYEFPILSFYKYNKIFVYLSQICLTERCTLKCTKCAHACNNVPINSSDESFDNIRSSADYFFNTVDFVKEFVLIGGEPLLSSELKKAIEYIGGNYRDRISTFGITTNGTILPDRELLELCRLYKITFQVSDYSDTIPKLKPRYKLFYDSIDGIDSIVWKTNNKDSWFDYGFFEVDNGDDENKLIRIFDGCRTPCREIRGNKYYYCVMARSVPENTDKNIGLEEYFDMSGEVNKKEFVEFELGYSTKGYLSMCRYCRGKESQLHSIPAAVQDDTSKLV